MKKRLQFGDFFKEKRINQGFTLRKFCGQYGFDPGNISKLERGIFAAPQSKEKLESYAAALGIEPGSEDWIDFFDLATVSNKNFDLLSLKNKKIVEKLPVLIRTLDNKDMTEERLGRLVEMIAHA